MSAEGTSDVLLDMSATIPHVGSEVRPLHEGMRKQTFRVNAKGDGDEDSGFRYWHELTDIQKRRANEIEAANADVGQGSEFKVKPRAVEFVRPFEDRLVVLPDAAEEMIGSFYVPDTAQERPSRGTVVAVGPHVGPSIREGMRVIYGHFTGSECLHAGKECLLMRVADLYGEVVMETVG